MPTLHSHTHCQAAPANAQRVSNITLCCARGKAKIAYTQTVGTHPKGRHDKQKQTLKQQTVFQPLRKIKRAAIQRTSQNLAKESTKTALIKWSFVPCFVQAPSLRIF